MIANSIVEVELTTACTRKCWFCRTTLLPEDRDAPAYLTAERHAALMDALAAVAYDKWIVYCGHGEPTLHPKLVEFVAEAKAKVPNAKLAMSTNGDPLTPAMLRSLMAVDSIVWDVYENDDTSRRIGCIVRESGYPPERFAVIDATAFPVTAWLSRAGTGFKSDRAKAAGAKVCGAPTRKIFLTARGRFALCCNDGHRRLSWDCSLPELLKDPAYNRIKGDLLIGNREPYAPCRDCEYVGTPPAWPENGLSAFYPAINKTRFWPGDAA